MDWNSLSSKGVLKELPVVVFIRGWSVVQGEVNPGNHHLRITITMTITITITIPFTITIDITITKGEMDPDNHHLTILAKCHEDLTDILV